MNSHEPWPKEEKRLRKFEIDLKFNKIFYTEININKCVGLLRWTASIQKWQRNGIHLTETKQTTLK